MTDQFDARYLSLLREALSAPRMLGRYMPSPEQIHHVDEGLARVAGDSALLQRISDEVMKNAPTAEDLVRLTHIGAEIQSAFRAAQAVLEAARGVLPVS